MKTTARTNLYKTKNKDKRKHVLVQKKSPSKSTLTLLGRSTKRYSKIALKSMLLSKAFSSSVKVLVVCMVVFTALYGAYAFIGTSVSKGVIVSKSEIINRVAKLTILPKGEPEAVVRVEDSESLKKQNSFYEGVKEGDYILVYPQLAVIYDLRNNVIIGLKHSR